MTFEEFGIEKEKTLMLLPGTACLWYKHKTANDRICERCDAGISKNAFLSKSCIDRIVLAMYN
jgi:hypothetical protein